MKRLSLPISRRTLTLLAVGLLAIADLAIIGYVLWFSTPKTRPAPPGPEQSSRPSATGETDAIIGPLLLLEAERSGAPDHPGQLLRYPRRGLGGSPNGPPEPVTVPGLTQMLGAQATRSGWVIIGTDKDCAVTAWESDSAAQDWTTIPVPAAVLFPSPKQDGTLQIGDQPVDPGHDCTPVAVQTLTPNRNQVLCASGAVLEATTRNGRTAFASAGSFPPGTVGFAPRGAQTAVLYADSSCAAASTLLDAEGESSDYHCFGTGRAPLGITWAADRLVAQVGNDLMELADNGEWSIR